MATVQIESARAISAWENEGGALGWVPTGALPLSLADKDEIMKHLGSAVVAHWDELPQDFKQTVFRELSARTAEPGEMSLKERVARYLHLYGQHRWPPHS